MKVVSGIPVVFDVHFEPVFLMTQLPGMSLLYPPKLLAELGEKIISGGERKIIKGMSYSLCSAPDQILYLALHIFHHNFTDSMRYQLLDSVVRKSRLSFRTISEKSRSGTRFARSLANDTGARDDAWEELVHTINDYHLQGYTYGVFLLLKKYFHTPIPPSFLQSIRPKWYMLHVTCYIVKHVDIFSQDTRTKAGIQRFILIFLLSPNPWWKKILLAIHPQTIRLLFTVALSNKTAPTG
jgi:hypothetical protein